MTIQPLFNPKQQIKRQIQNYMIEESRRDQTINNDRRILEQRALQHFVIKRKSDESLKYLQFFIEENKDYKYFTPEFWYNTLQEYIGTDDWVDNNYTSKVFLLILPKASSDLNKMLNKKSFWQLSNQLNNYSKNKPFDKIIKIKMNILQIIENYFRKMKKLESALLTKRRLLKLTGLNKNNLHKFLLHIYNSNRLNENKYFIYFITRHLATERGSFFNKIKLLIDNYNRPISQQEQKKTSIKKQLNITGSNQTYNTLLSRLKQIINKQQNQKLL